MSEGWPAQVVNESGVMESDAAAEASQVAGKVSEAVKGSAHAVQGAVAGVCQCPRSPPPPQATKIKLSPLPVPYFLLSPVCISSHLHSHSPA